MLGRPGRWGIAALLICASACAFGQAVAILTVAEGTVVLVRGTTTYTAGQGVSVQNGDMLGTDAKGQAQIEFDDGAILNLSRGARAYLLASQGPGGEPGAALQSGWAKFARDKAKSKPFRYTLPLVRLSTAAATGVLHPGGDSSELFIETGAAKLVELQRNGTPGGSRDLKGGEFVVRRDGQPLALAPRPSADFVRGMPGYFRDDLPVYQSRVRGRSAEPRREHEATYEEVEPWLKASLPVRRGLAERFHGRAKDAQFRSKVVENLASHPEWDAILNPDKYRKEEEKAAGKAEESKKVQ